MFWGCMGVILCGFVMLDGLVGREMNGMVEMCILGDYKWVLDIEDEINYNFGDYVYMVLWVEDDDELVYGDVMFVDLLGKVYSDVDWMVMGGKLVIVVDLVGVLWMVWMVFLVVYDMMDNEEE